ncbi:WD40 repeat domain-containing protein [Methanolobus profundi]|uniref:WD40 repeat n=1 Tax=Methanolobus profundi TaxID=487685 RepID=A0A1I4PLN0_9EURY|nr:hypothetical protein [Methanolobus profundi]SFM28455.1 hypothetical protein SAMN04488696_0736 [Methanolobus profundi]
MPEKKKPLTIALSLLLLMSIVPGVMTDVWDVISPAKSLDEFEPFKTSLVTGSGVENVDISPDGKFVVSSTLGMVNLWDAADLDLLYGYHVMNDESGATVKQREPYYNLVDIEFSKPGNYYLVGSNSDHPHYGGMEASHLTLYNMTHSIGVASRTFRTHQINDTLIEDTAISPDETTYAACTEMTTNPESCTITLWDIETGEVANSITSDNYKATSITFTPDGKYLVASFDNNINPDRIVVFALENGDVVRTMEERAVTDLHFSDDGNILAAGSIYRSEVIVWDGNSYEEMYRLRGLELSPDSTALSRDGKYIMAMDYSRLIVWDTESKRKIVSSRHRNIDFVDSFSSGTFSDDGKYLVMALVVKRGSEYTRQPDYNSGMVFVYDFEEILESYYE